MKRLWIATALLLVLLGSTLANSWYLERLITDLGRQLVRAQLQADENNWAQAQKLTKQVTEHWQKHDFYFHIMLPHDDIDDIHLTFREVQEYLLLQETDQYNAANAKLIAQLGLLAEMEQLNVKNIL